MMFQHMCRKVVFLLLMTLCLSGCFVEKYEGSTYTVKRGALVDQVEAGGVLESADGVYVSVPKIQSVHEFTISFLAPEGSEVKKGMPIVGFDTKRPKEQLMRVQGQLASERKSLEKIKLEEQENLETLVLDSEERKVDAARAFRKTDVAEEHTSRNEVEKNIRDYKLAKAQEEMAKAKVEQQRVGMKRRIAAQERAIERLEKQVAMYQDSIAKMTIKAPKEGLVVYEENWDGDKPTVGDRMWVGRSVMQLPDLTQMQVKAAVDEPDAGRVHMNQVAEIRLDANPDKVFYGKVTHLGRIFHKKSSQKPSVVFDALITLDEPDTEIMRPGMTAKVRLIIDRAEDILLLSEEAVLTEDDQTHVIRVAESGKSDKVSVELGRAAGGFVEILSGLAEGDRVAMLNSSKEEE